jgi:hypothetical protein
MKFKGVSDAVRSSTPCEARIEKLQVLPVPLAQSEAHEARLEAE